MLKENDYAATLSKKKGLVLVIFQLILYERFWLRYLDRLNKVTGGRPPACHLSRRGHHISFKQAGDSWNKKQ